MSFLSLPGHCPRAVPCASFTVSLTATLAVWCSNGGNIRLLDIMLSLILRMYIVVLSLAQELARVFQRGEGKFGEGALHRTYDKIRALPQMGTSPRTSLPLRATRDHIPSWSALHALMGELERKGGQQAAIEEAARIREWQAWMKEAWQVQQGAVYKWIREDVYSPPVCVVARPGGSLTSNIEKMGRLLHNAWDPVLRKYADAQEPDLQGFIAEFGAHLMPCPRMPDTVITGQRLCSGLRKMPETTTGTDGWSRKMLLALPLELFDWLVHFYTMIEEGQWPEQLAEGFISLIPKGEGAHPPKMRPPSVLSMSYRLWAGLGLEQALVWQEGWIHDEAYGFRKSRVAGGAS